MSKKKIFFGRFIIHYFICYELILIIIIISQCYYYQFQYLIIYKKSQNLQYFMDQQYLSINSKNNNPVQNYLFKARNHQILYQREQYQLWLRKQILKQNEQDQSKMIQELKKYNKQLIKDENNMYKQIMHKLKNFYVKSNQDVKQKITIEFSDISRYTDLEKKLLKKKKEYTQMSGELFKMLEQEFELVIDLNKAYIAYNKLRMVLTWAKSASIFQVGVFLYIELANVLTCDDDYQSMQIKMLELFIEKSNTNIIYENLIKIKDIEQLFGYKNLQIRYQFKSPYFDQQSIHDNLKNGQYKINGSIIQGYDQQKKQMSQNIKKIISQYELNQKQKQTNVEQKLIKTLNLETIYQQYKRESIFYDPAVTISMFDSVLTVSGKTQLGQKYFSIIHKYFEEITNISNFDLSEQVQINNWTHLFTISRFIQDLDKNKINKQGIYLTGSLPKWILLINEKNKLYCIVSSSIAFEELSDYMNIINSCQKQVYKIRIEKFEKLRQIRKKMKIFIESKHYQNFEQKQKISNLNNFFFYLQITLVYFSCLQMIQKNQKNEKDQQQSYQKDQKIGKTRIKLKIDSMEKFKQIDVTCGLKDLTKKITNKFILK